MKKPRNYKKEHKAGGLKAKAARASRNRANRMLKPPKGSEVHHVNGNPLDNRRSNLKVIPKSENRRIQPKRKMSRGRRNK